MSWFSFKCQQGRCHEWTTRPHTHVLHLRHVDNWPVHGKKSNALPWCRLKVAWIFFFRGLHFLDLSFRPVLRFFFYICLVRPPYFLGLQRFGPLIYLLVHKKFKIPLSLSIRETPLSSGRDKAQNSTFEKKDPCDLQLSPFRGFFILITKQFEFLNFEYANPLVSHTKCNRWIGLESCRVLQQVRSSLFIQIIHTVGSVWRKRNSAFSFFKTTPIVINHNVASCLFPDLRSGPIYPDHRFEVFYVKRGSL